MQITISCKWTAVAGKWEEECEGVHGDANIPTTTSPTSTAKLSICEQYSWATNGSTGIDTPIADTVILTRQICKVPLNAYGPVGLGLSAFLVGRSSSTIQGINVHLGIIDSDYLGQIHATVSVSELPVIIQKGTCIAQLVPFISCVLNAVNQSRDAGGFGSAGASQVFWTQKVTDQHPEKQCIVTAKGHHPEIITITGLIEAGTNVTVTSQLFLPQSWPLTQTGFGIAGLGCSTVGGLLLLWLM